jgi:hypothetical protein
MELISVEERLLEENARLRELVEQYHHHFSVGKLLQDAKLSEIGAWIIAGDKLQQEAEKLLPMLR